MKNLIQLIIVLSLAALITGCGSEHDHGHDHHGHDHHDHAPKLEEGDHDHGERVRLGVFNISGVYVEAIQAHGMIKAGAEGHLALKLPYSDQGETVVRAWIGNEDRTLSSVGKGKFSAKYSLYDIHMMAPKPLPEDAKWWVEIEKPDGTKALGSIPLRKDIN
ncbi:MAG: hypothetical protein AAGH40_06525 [Verrucomicrobiota bacterium]